MTASTHPPVDPELRAVLAGIPAGQRHLMRLEDILARREEQALMLPAVDDTLRRGGAVELEERQIPGPAGAPDLSVLILRPANGQWPWSRFRSSTAWPRSTRTRRRLRTATPAWSGPERTAASSASIRPA